MYINSVNGVSLPNRNKAQELINRANGIIIPTPKSKDDFVEDMVCVMNNGLFEAAGYAYSPEEMMVFANPDGVGEKLG